MAESRVAELARAEADEAEREETEEPTENPAGPSEDEDGGDETHTVPSPPPPVEAPAAIGPEQIAKAEKAVAAQKKKLAGILGDDYVAHDCLVCAGLGFVPELPEVGTTFTLTEQAGEVVLTVAGPSDLSGYREAKDKDTCPWCDGLGQVRTGSQADAFKLAACTKCSGAGWVVVPVQEEQTAQASWTDEMQAVGNGQHDVNFPPDQWGRAWGHKHYGVAPALITG